MGSLTDNHVLDLLAAGADSMPNMFDVKFTLLPSSLSDTTLSANSNGASIEQDQLTLRVKGFKVPESSNAKYKIPYKSIEIERPLTKVTFERTFDLTFRLDAYWKVFSILNRWSNLFANPVTGFATNTLDQSTLGTVVITALKNEIQTPLSSGFSNQEGIDSNTLTNAAETISWKFDQVWCTKVTPPDFTTGETSGAQEVTASFSFATMTTTGGIYLQ